MATRSASSAPVRRTPRRPIIIGRAKGPPVVVLPENDPDLTKTVRVIGRGIFADEQIGANPLRAAYASVDNERVTLTLDDQRKVSAPIEWYPRLQHASPVERN